jgi:uncharacterized hydrophobic protein (TIGR00271 family)
MNVFARFRAIDENDKAAAVRKLMQASTPSFDFFYFVSISVAMATLGLLLDSASIVIGSMLIAPILYPILGLSLGLVMSNSGVLNRSLLTLWRSLSLALLVSIVITFIVKALSPDLDIEEIGEVMSRVYPSTEYFLVAVFAGAGVSYALAQPEWSETLPGIAISVALIPPLAVVGIGIAEFDMLVVTGSAVMFLLNIFGIMLAAMVSFSMMNLYEKQNIAESTIKREAERAEKEQAAIAEVNGQAVPETVTEANNDNHETNNDKPL